MKTPNSPKQTTYNYDNINPHICLSQFLSSLWVLPVLLLLMQMTIHLTNNPIIHNIPAWLLSVDTVIFIIAFTAAAAWVHLPLRHASHQYTQSGLEEAMSSIPLRAIKGFGVAGLIYVIYLLAIISISSAMADISFSPRMVVALSLSICFSLGILLPTLAVALTMAWMAKSRKRLSVQQLFIGNLEQLHSYPWLIRSSNRPWLIFGVTSLLPVATIGIFTWLMLGSTDNIEKQFILGQATILFFNLIAGGTALVWVTSHTVQRITRELATGLNFLRQGKFDGHVAVMVDDDMGDLARGLNTALLGLKEREQLKDSLEIASDIQRGLMPRGEPNIQGYAISGYQESCYAVGGDYYDYITRSNGTTWLVIADVAGKGYPAALTVANLQAMLHALAGSKHISLLDAVNYVNNALHKSLQGGRFVTVFIAELNPDEHTLEWLNAGHIPPLIWNNDHVSQLEATAPPLGMLPDISLHTESLTFSVGDALFSCTDGITEARKTSGKEMFGDQRVQAWFEERHQLDPSVVASSMLARLDETGFNTHDDDITMLCIKRSNHA